MDPYSKISTPGPISLIAASTGVRGCSPVTNQSLGSPTTPNSAATGDTDTRLTGLRPIFRIPAWANSAAMPGTWLSLNRSSIPSLSNRIADPSRTPSDDVQMLVRPSWLMVADQPALNPERHAEATPNERPSLDTVAMPCPGRACDGNNITIPTRLCKAHFTDLDYTLFRMNLQEHPTQRALGGSSATSKRV